MCIFDLIACRSAFHEEGKSDVECLISTPRLRTTALETISLSVPERTLVLEVLRTEVQTRVATLTPRAYQPRHLRGGYETSS